MLQIRPGDSISTLKVPYRWLRSSDLPSHSSSRLRSHSSSRLRSHPPSHPPLSSFPASSPLPHSPLRSPRSALVPTLFQPPPPAALRWRRFFAAARIASILHPLRVNSHPLLSRTLFAASVRRGARACVSRADSRVARRVSSHRSILRSDDVSIDVVESIF